MSFIVIVLYGELVAKPSLSVAPAVINKDSVPSVVLSAFKVNEILPILSTIVTLPVSDPAVKSFAVIPVIVYGTVTLSNTSVVFRLI